MTNAMVAVLGEIADVNWGDTSITKKSYVSQGERYQAFSASGPDGALPYFDYDRHGVVISAIGANAGATWLASGKWSCIKNTIRFYSRDESVADTRFLYWATLGNNVWPLRGSAQPFISQGEARKITVALLPIKDQVGIAATLGALDDKIESNRRAVHLEVELAIACLSSGESSVRVGDVATLAKGLSYKGSGLNDGADPGAVPMFNLGNFTRCGQLKPDGLKFYTGDSKQTHRLSEGELLIANTDLTQARELLGRGFLVPPTLTGAIHTHHTSVARFSDRPWLAVCLWAQLQTSNFRERAMGFATGTTVTALPSEAVLDFELRVPARGEDKVNEAMPLLRHAWQLDAECHHLELIRDTLLPELLSGRIRVPEAVEEAVG